MQCCFVRLTLLVAGTQAFAPAPIRWGGLNVKKFVLAPRVFPHVPSIDEVPFQRLTVGDPPGGMSPNVMPYFTVRPDGTIFWEATGRCLEAEGTASGDGVRVNHCTGRLDQAWKWLPWGPIQLKGTNKCLAVEIGTFNGAVVVLRECEHRMTESWRLEDPLLIPTLNPSSSVPHTVIPSAIMLLLRFVCIGFASIAIATVLTRSALAVWKSTAMLHSEATSTHPTMEVQATGFPFSSVSVTSAGSSVCTTLHPQIHDGRSHLRAVQPTRMSCVQMRASPDDLPFNGEVEPSICWQPFPEVPHHGISRRRLVSATTMAGLASLPAQPVSASIGPRSAAYVDEWLSIPVWPTWGGGRVIPISPEPEIADPFLLLAHHNHSFTPGDPLRGPFKAVGGALGLPYVGDEGFKMHPHRGIDIMTYVLDGSDGFRHKDSLGGACVYRGGSAQFMRSGRGAMHEEMWETRNDRTTRIELFQLWVNLPSKQKMAPAAIRYLGADWGAPFSEREETDKRGRVTKVRDVLDQNMLESASEGEGKVLDARPAMRVQHATMAPGATWAPSVPLEHTAMLYVRKGSLISAARRVGAGSTVIYDRDGDHVALTNTSERETCDLLLLTGAPLREPVALGGPIVMNTQEELAQAYTELREGTFLGDFEKVDV